jgi:RNA polymerase sigma factor (sigma-70 family)
MPAPGSVSQLLLALQRGDDAAAQPLWERYHSRLVGLARQILQRTNRRVADEDDVVQNAFKSFFNGLSRGRFPRLNDRHGLWRLLVVITARKAINQMREAFREISGKIPSQGGSKFWPFGLEDPELALVIDDQPSPEFVAQLIEHFEVLMLKLEDDRLRQIAILRMEGWSYGEIAQKLACSRRTVIRKLEIIRVTWSAES